MVNDNTAQPLTCDNCGEASTNPGQFMPDGRWVCTASCRDELSASLAANGGIPQDEDFAQRPEVSGNDIADEIEALNQAEREAEGRKFVEARYVD